MFPSRKHCRWCAWVWLLVVLFFSTETVGGPPQPVANENAPWPILPLKDVRPGMRGYGLTVFSGVKPEPFPVRVVGVLPKHTHLMDIILVETTDPRLKHTGIVAGMSGSPIYLDGKLAGALSLGWAFSKDAVAGVTPIEYMLEDMRRRLRGRDHNHMLLSDRGGTVHSSSPVRAMQQAFQAGFDPSKQVAMPLLVSGLDGEALRLLSDAVKPCGLTVMQGGGSGTLDGAGPRSFEPGSAIAVDLVRGDVSVQTIGTVTAVAGSRVLAFGHSMLNAGELYFPVSTAEITTFMPSLVSSFKLGHSLHPVGVLVQDRVAGIVADTSRTAEMIPATFTFLSAGQKPKVLRTELAVHKLLTAVLAGVVGTQGINIATSDVADAVVRVDSTLKVAGFAPLKHTDHLFVTEGFSGRMLGKTTGLRQMQELLGNPFAPVRVESFELTVEVSWKPQAADLVGLSVPSDEIEAGQKIPLQVTVRPYGGALAFVTLPVEIPRTLAGQTVKIEVQAGPDVKPDTAPPNSLSDFVENLRKIHSGRSVAVTLHSTSEGVHLRGRQVEGLPASVLATLRPTATSRRGDVQKRLYRTVYDMDWVMAGKQELSVMIKDFDVEKRRTP